MINSVSTWQRWSTLLIVRWREVGLWKELWRTSDLQRKGGHIHIRRLQNSTDVSVSCILFYWLKVINILSVFAADGSNASHDVGRKEKTKKKNRVGALSMSFAETKISFSREITRGAGTCKSFCPLQTPVFIVLWIYFSFFCNSIIYCSVVLFFIVLQM